MNLARLGKHGLFALFTLCFGRRNRAIARLAASHKPLLSNFNLYRPLQWSLLEVCCSKQGTHAPCLISADSRDLSAVLPATMRLRGSASRLVRRTVSAQASSPRGRVVCSDRNQLNGSLSRTVLAWHQTSLPGNPVDRPRYFATSTIQFAQPESATLDSANVQASDATIENVDLTGWETIIGLEIHTQLKTRRKLFSCMHCHVPYSGLGLTMLNIVFRVIPL